MAAINSIETTLNSPLPGQATEAARPKPENQPKKASRELSPPPPPRGVDSVPAVKAQQDKASVPQDQANIRNLLDHLQKTLNEYSAEPHEVGFREDPSTDQVVIEIRNQDGELLKQFPPEKVLNLHQKLDELSGMVIDRMT